MANTRVYIVPSGNVQRSAYPAGDWQLVNAPTGVLATVNGSAISLGWTDTNSGASEYVVQVSSSAGSGYSDSVTTEAGATSITLTGFAPGTYYTRIFGQIGTVRSDSPSDVVTSVIADAPATGQRVISGTSFGPGPSIVLFDRADGADNTEYDLEADIGAWTAVHTGTAGMVGDARYFEANNRTWLGGRRRASIADTAANLSALRYEHPSVFTEFYREYRLLIPDGYYVPGTSTPNTKDWTDTDSRWKVLWGWIRAYGATVNTDCCYPTLVPNATFALTGNAVAPRYWTGSAYASMNFSMAHFSPVNENIIGIYVSGRESSEGSHDGTVEQFEHNGAALRRSIYAGSADFWRGISDATLPAYGEDTFILPGWQGNINSANTMHCYADVYLAVGANSRARVYSHNQPTISASTQVQIVPPDSWSDSAIYVSPHEREQLPYMSVIKADGTLLENVTWSAV